MKTFDMPAQTRLKITKATPEDALAASVGQGDSGADEQAEIEAGMRDSVAAAGLKPKRGRVAA